MVSINTPRHLFQKLLPYALAFGMTQIFLLETATGQDHCKVRYTYNAAGDRIKRDWYCWDPLRPAEKEELLEDKSVSGPLAETHLDIVPNPATSSISVVVPDEAMNADIEIISPTGGIVMTTKATSSSMIFDVSGFGSGLYFMRLSLNGDLLITPFMVEH